MGRPKKLENKALEPTLEDKKAEEVELNSDTMAFVSEALKEIPRKTIKCKILAWERSISQHKAGDIVEIEASQAETLKAFNFLEFV